LKIIFLHREIFEFHNFYCFKIIFLWKWQGHNVTHPLFAMFMRFLCWNLKPSLKFACCFLLFKKWRLLLMYVELVQLMTYRKIENNINQFFTLKYNTNHVWCFILWFAVCGLLFVCHVLQKVFVLKLGNHLENLHDACCCWKNGIYSPRHTRANGVFRLVNPPLVNSINVVNIVIAWKWIRKFACFILSLH
jgi:hypothetical protein